MLKLILIPAGTVKATLEKPGIDTTPAGKAMFQMLGVFAEFERAMIQERVKAGLARAKAKGVKLGRAKVSKDVEAQILALRESTEPPMGMLKIAQSLGLGTGTVQRVIKEISDKSTEKQ